jgi:predicted Co/Zn/Cd cation transporter (cation efflux family)
MQEKMDTLKEQEILKQSIWVTAILAVMGIAFGLWVNSQSIAFEGIYSIIDALMTFAALLVSKLIMGEGTRRFQYGYWHLEPLVAACNGTVLAITCLYALVNSINAILEGGRKVNFEHAIIYTIIASIVSITMFFYIRSANKKVRSEFLAIDAQGWLIGGSLALALCISFIAAILFSETRFEPFLLYTDPLILIILSLFLIQIPLRTVWKAMHEVFIVTPVALDKKIHAVVDKISLHYQFKMYKTYVAKIGRAHFIEINIVTKPNFAIEGVSTLDRIRQEIASQLTDTYRNSWLTITFTADKKWL